jgi:phosphonate transport system substrate-binding protein
MKKSTRYLTILLTTAASLAVVCLTLTGCPSSGGGSRNGGEPPAVSGGGGAPEGPVRIAFVPSVEQGQIELSLGEFESKLAELIDHPVKANIVLSYPACIEQMAAGHFEAALLPAFAYVLAHDRYDVRVVLKAVRKGSATYRGEIITRVDSGINTLEDLRGRTFAFTEASSASGCLYPKTFLIANGIDPDVDLAEYGFVGGSHPAVVEAVYQGRFDAGACFDDARLRLLETEPDVMEEVKVIAYTPDIPSDTVSFRAGLEGPFYDRLTQGLIELSKEGEEGPLYAIYEIEELVPAQDSDYDPIRQMAETLNYDIEASLKEG